MSLFPLFLFYYAKIIVCVSLAGSQHFDITRKREMRDMAHYADSLSKLCYFPLPIVLVLIMSVHVAASSLRRFIFTGFTLDKPPRQRGEEHSPMSFICLLVTSTISRRLITLPIRRLLTNLDISCIKSGVGMEITRSMLGSRGHRFLEGGDPFRNFSAKACQVVALLVRM